MLEMKSIFQYNELNQNNLLWNSIFVSKKMIKKNIIEYTYTVIYFFVLRALLNQKKLNHPLMLPTLKTI